MKKIAGILLTCLLGASGLHAQQDTLRPIPFGDFDQWLVRRIKESSVIGGRESLVYMIAPVDTLVGPQPYVNRSASPWSSSNVISV